VVGRQNADRLLPIPCTQGTLPWRPLFGFLYAGAHWRHLANTIEPSMCDGDAVLCQITLTTCCIFTFLSNYVICCFYVSVSGDRL